MDRNLFPLPTAGEVRPAVNLAELARQINAEHEAGEDASRKRIEHYRRAGQFLVQAKRRRVVTASG